MKKKWEVLEGDCIGVMAKLPAGRFHSMVTDPPAGISFMGKEWDEDKGGRDQWIKWMTNVMRHSYRLLRPGGHALVWALPRTSHWTATACENAGFEIRDIIMHIFGSGFPKSLNISKAIDKAAGAEREVLGKKTGPGYGKDDDGNQGFKGGKYKNSNVSKTSKDGDAGLTITAPATRAAKQWDGWGTALKPAAEHWILIRRPLIMDTAAENCIQYGAGGLNINASEIRFQNEKDRFPANVMLTHHPDCEPSPLVFPDGSTASQCHDDCPMRMMDEQSGVLKTNPGKYKREKAKDASNVYSHMEGLPAGTVTSKGDSGGVSRFFYCAKASKSERNKGLEGMPKKDHCTLSTIETGGNKLGRKPKEQTRPQQNNHPCVKPTKLMQYLITMITPVGGHVLDPFNGSGSTGVAAVKAGFSYTGIEKEEEYAKISRKRIEAALK